jgi:GNAT superfamily N-acetyltransferase
MQHKRGKTEGREEPVVVVREATAGDLSLILTFIKELAEFERLSHAVVATEEALYESLFGDRSYAHALIGEYGGEPVGFAVYFYNFSTFQGRHGLYIEDIYIQPEKRGLGIGKMLLEHCARIAVSAGCARMEFAVLEWNPARRFYEAIGAEGLDDWIIYRLSSEKLKALAGI